MNFDRIKFEFMIGLFIVFVIGIVSVAWKLFIPIIFLLLISWILGKFVLWGLDKLETKNK